MRRAIFFSCVSLADQNYVTRPPTASGDTWGYSTCRCLVNISDECKASGTGAPQQLGHRESWLRPANYGISCKAHDYVESCPGGEIDWCSDEWCYVDPFACDVSNVASRIPLCYAHYSYATCGHLNQYEGFFLERFLRNKTLRVVQMSNSGGWKGNYCTGWNECTGPVQAFMDKLFQEAGASMNVVMTYSGPDINNTFTNPKAGAPAWPPKQVMDQFRVLYPDDHSAFNLCCVAASMGYVDVCIGAFMITTKRERMVHLVHWNEEEISLITKAPALADLTLKQVFDGPLRPFTYRCWLVIMVSIFVFSAAAQWFAEDKKNKGRLRFMMAGVCEGCVSFFGAGSTLEPTGWSSRIVVFGFVFFIMTVTSAYTANLASLLVIENESSHVETIEHCLVESMKLCVQQTWSEEIMEMYPALVERDLIVKELGRFEALPHLDDDTCQAVLMFRQDFEKAADCNKIKSKAPILLANEGFPVTGVYTQAIEWWTQKLMGEAYKRDVLEQYQIPPSQCKAGGGVDTREGLDPLTLKEMSGCFVIAGIFMVLGILASCCRCIGRGIERRLGLVKDEDDESMSDSLIQARDAEDEMSLASSGSGGPSVDNYGFATGEGSCVDLADLGVGRCTEINRRRV